MRYNVINKTCIHHNEQDLAKQLKDAKEELNKHSGMDAEFEKLKSEV